MEKTEQQKLDDITADVKRHLDVQSEIKTSLDACKPDHGVVTAKVSEIETWLRTLEGKMATARYTGVDGRDQVMAAIPDAQKGCISLHMRHGLKEDEATKRTANEAWIKAALTRLNPYKTGAEKETAVSVMESVHKSFGDDPLVSKAALVEGTGALGGFKVPQPLEAEVLRLIEDNAVLRPRARKMPMTVYKHLIPNLANNVTVYIIPEAGTITDGLPGALFGQSTLEAKMIAALATASMQSPFTLR